MDPQHPPRCADLPCPERVVATLRHRKDTYHYCFTHLCAAAEQGLVNEERALRAETRYADLVREEAPPQEVAARISALRAVMRGVLLPPRVRTLRRAAAPSRARRG